MIGARGGGLAVGRSGLLGSSVFAGSGGENGFSGSRGL